MDELKKIKSLIEAHRAKFGKKKPFPKNLWKEIIKATESHSVTKVASFLEISGPNISRHIKKSKELRPADKKNGPSFLKAPRSILVKKQMTLELPHNIILRIDL